MQGGRREEVYRKMYDDAMDGVAEVLVHKVNTLGDCCTAVSCASKRGKTADGN